MRTRKGTESGSLRQKDRLRYRSAAFGDNVMDSGL